MLGDLGERAAWRRRGASREARPGGDRQDRPHLRLGPREAGLSAAPPGRLPPASRWRSRATSSSSTPSPVDAVVTRTSGRFGRGRSFPSPAPTFGLAPATSIARSCDAVRRAPGPVALVDDDEVGHLKEPRLDRLDLVAHLGRLEHDGRVGRRRDLDLALARPDRLDEDEVEAGGVHHRGRGRRRRGKAAGVAAGRHRADEDVTVAGICLHPDPVAEQRAAGDRARGVDGHDADRAPGRADALDQRRDEGGLSRAGRPGDPDEMRPPGLRVQPAHGDFGDWRSVLDGSEEPCQRPTVTCDGGRGEVLALGGRIDGARRCGLPHRAGPAAGRWPAGTRRPGRSWSRARRPRRPPIP